MPDTFSALSDMAREIVRALNWQVYHTPENLTLFLLGEVAEVGEYCQWLTLTKIESLQLRDTVGAEVADVAKNVLYLANILPLGSPLEIETLLSWKLKLDEDEYSPQEFWKRSRYEVKDSEGNIREERRKRKPMPPLPPNVQTLPVLTVQEIQRKAWQFVLDRGWEEFHTPSSVALALAVKSGEVATCYQRRPKPIEYAFERMIIALADVPQLFAIV